MITKVPTYEVFHFNEYNECVNNTFGTPSTLLSDKYDDKYLYDLETPRGHIEGERLTKDELINKLRQLKETK